MRLRIAAVMLVAVAAFASDGPRRPKITGFAHVAFYAESVEKTNDFYTKTVGLHQGSRPGVWKVGSQTVEAEPMPKEKPANMLSHIAFATSDADQMRRYLASKGVDVPADIHHEKNGTQWFALKDPEGVPIEFVQEKAERDRNPQALSERIIHVGFVVHDKAKEDAFWKEILGFKLYWHGAMEEGHPDDWIAMQVPDGNEWIEYMMTPADAKLTAQHLGVLYHYSLGVTDIHAPEKMLLERGWKPSGPSQVQMGKDGKYQLNIYDPDLTRVELMEFKNAQKPCCAEFTQPHPEPAK